ncbi:MAG: hypothetical protein DRO67_00110 [Candidatus Asgardarchaeum californiense]|nr:MAG: hypothetical protein DRO67_00110 [Candidatus Asgardarchaeum californiense]
MNEKEKARMKADMALQGLMEGALIKIEEMPSKDKEIMAAAFYVLVEGLSIFKNFVSEEKQHKLTVGVLNTAIDMLMEEHKEPVQ